MIRSETLAKAWPPACRIAGWLGVAAIVALSVVPGPERPHSGLPGRIEHVAAYALTAAALGFGYYRNAGTRLRLAALLVGLAGAMEVAQIWIPGRTAHILDAVAGWLGTVIGLSVAAFIVRMETRR